METEVYVYVDIAGTPYLAGRLWARVRKGRESATFEYHPGWLENRLVPVDNSLIFINFMNRLRAKRTDSLTNRQSGLSNLIISLYIIKLSRGTTLITIVSPWNRL